MSTTEQTTPADGPPAVALNRNKDFRLMWTAAGSTLFAVRVASIVYPMLALAVTGSAKLAGVVGFAVMLPQLLVQLPAGAIVDRFNRRRVMIVSDLGCLIVAAAVAVALAVSSIPWSVLVLAAFVQGSFAVSYHLAERSYLPELVPPEQFGAAASQNEARSRAAALLGQSGGGGLFSLGHLVPFVGGAVAHAISVGLLLLIRKPAVRAKAPPRRAMLREIGEGISWLWRQGFLRTVMLLISVTNVVFSAISLVLMVIVRDAGGSAASVGVILALGGVGGVLGALTGQWWLRRITLRTLAVGVLAAWALVTFPISLTANPYVLSILFAVNGYVGGLLNVAGGIYLLRITPNHMLGRANAVGTLIGLGPVAFGSLIAGFLVDAIGTSSAVGWLAAVLAFLVVLAVLSPSVRGMRDRVEDVPAVARSS